MQRNIFRRERGKGQKPGNPPPSRRLRLAPPHLCSATRPADQGSSSLHRWPRPFSHGEGPGSQPGDSVVSCPLEQEYWLQCANITPAFLCPGLNPCPPSSSLHHRGRESASVPTCWTRAVSLRDREGQGEEGFPSEMLGTTRILPLRPGQM